MVMMVTTYHHQHLELAETALLGMVVVTMAYVAVKLDIVVVVNIIASVERHVCFQRYPAQQPAVAVHGRTPTENVERHVQSMNTAVTSYVLML
jgi:hypothetical protein